MRALNTTANVTADRGLVASAALLTTYIQAAAISLPNAAVFHIGGALSTTDDEMGWFFSAYIAASAVITPMTGWLANTYGRKMVFQISIAVFATGLVLATQATTTLQFVATRIIQGAGSGPLAPLSLAILLHMQPPDRHARVKFVWAMTLLTGLLSGPAIGGWLGEYYGWPSLFYITAGLGAGVLLVMTLLPEDSARGPKSRFDVFGLATLSMGLVGLQMMLDRGQRLEWFASAEIRVEAAASALGFYLYAIHILTADSHFLSKALFKDRNFVLSAVMFFAFGFVLLPTVALTSPMLEELLGYPADITGYLTIPRSVTLLGAFALASRAAGRVDTRAIIITGMSLVIYGSWRMTGYSPLMDWRPVVVAGVLQGAGLGLLMPALTRAAFSTLDPALRPEGNGLFNLFRLYGSTIGIAVVQLFFFSNTQMMHTALAKAVTSHRLITHAGGLPSRQGLAALNEMVTGQAAAVAIVDQFKLLMVVMAVASPLVLFLQKPRSGGP